MDLALARFLNQLGLGIIDPITDLVCEVPFLIGLWIALVILAVRFDRPEGRRVALAVLVAMALHFIISEALLKHVVLAALPMRIRPYLAHPDMIQPIGYRFTDSSFPSSHAASTAAVLTVFGYIYRRYSPAAVLALLFVVIMCFSRVHNGMHYPTDVLTGAVLGVMYGALAIRAAAEIARRRSGAGNAEAPAVVPPTS